MSQFIHFTIAVEYAGRITGENQTEIANSIRDSLMRHAETVAVDRKFDAVAPKVKRRILPVEELPDQRGHYGWHVHDNDGACTPCSVLYGIQHDSTI